MQLAHFAVTVNALEGLLGLLETRTAEDVIKDVTVASRSDRGFIIMDVGV